MLTDVFVKNLAGYHSYHLNPHNQLTHFFGIPMIVVSVLWIASWLSIGDVQFSTILFIAFVGLWVSMDLMIGLILSVVFLPFLLMGNAWFPTLNTMSGNLVFWGLFVGGWIVQLVGHAFEGRRPALMDSLFQALLGPMFLVYEVFVHTGWRKSLQEKIQTELAGLVD